ncbi:Dabb family protein [uncultured Ruminococcus sp.]|uniref:Dabb family protein n=1 Tax=uncultured Ruminococcus sp. TaxID=165186 RepID=UPI0025CC948C|nr:Dabb family protein [uncultured Ruminococcus sp.]
MIRHILFWNFTEKVKNEHSEDEVLVFLQNSVETMNGHIDGLIHAEIGKNFAGGYDLVFYSEFTDENALKGFKDHPLHVAHRERCMDIVTDRLCGDVKADEKM